MQKYTGRPLRTPKTARNVTSFAEERFRSDGCLSMCMYFKDPFGAINSSSEK